MPSTSCFPIPSPASPVDDTLPAAVPALDTTDPDSVAKHLDSLLAGGDGLSWTWPGTAAAYLEVNVEGDGSVTGEFQCLPAGAVAAMLKALAPPV